MAFGIAVVGLDHWYTAFGVIEAATQSEIAPLVSVAELRSERLDAVKARFPQVNVTGALSDVLEDAAVELMVLCAATSEAPALANQCLIAGKHVLCVKPPARTLTELDTVIEMARMSGRFFGSLESIQRLHPRVTLLRDLIRGGEIGIPLSLHQVGHGGLPQPWPGEDGDSWWLHAENVPGGAWIDHAIYAIDLARFVFEGEITAVAGHIENRVHSELGVEDYGAALLRLTRRQGGSVSLLIEDTWAAEPGRGASQQWIIGTAGQIRPDGPNWQVLKGKEETRHPVPNWQYFNLDTLAQTLQNGQTLPFGPNDARANLAACLAVYEAAKTPTPLF